MGYRSNMSQTALGIGAEHFTRLVAQLPVIVWSTDTELRLTSRYGGALAPGQTPGTFDGPEIASFVDAGDAPIVHAAHQAALRGESSSYETRFSGRTFTSHVEPLVDAHGDIVGVVGFAVDVTDARRAEDALRDSETHLRTIIESEPECVKLLDEQGRLLDMNPAGLAMIQAESIDQVRGAEITQLIAPEHRAPFNDLQRRVFAGGSGTLEFEIVGLKGRRMWLSTHAVPLRDTSGTVRSSLGITRDVSRRRVAEHALVESEQRFSKAFHANALPLLITRLEDGQVLDANEAFSRLINRPRDDVLGQTTVSLGVIDAGRRASVIQELADRGTVGDVELELFARDTGPRTVLLSLVKIEIGGQQCTLGTYRDITEAKRAEEQLRASRAALRSLATREQDIRESERTRIAREIHDSLGQALTALKLQLSAAQEAATRESPGLGTRLHETVSMVDDLVKSVRRIASDLRPPILDQLGLPAAVEWLGQDFSRRTGIRCKIIIHPTEGAIVDELATALFRIVQEALTNVLRHAGATRVDIELGMTSGCVALEINDDGSGITEASSIGPGSLGILGMRERASALGGVLEVAPRSGGGTRVAAWFPPTP
ncbi:MAG: PAS domain-containing protein [Gemmatimonadales bacterium]